MPGTSKGRSSRERLIAELGLAPDMLTRIERAGGLAADAEGLFDPVAAAAAAIRFGAARADAADVGGAPQGDDQAGAP